MGHFCFNQTPCLHLSRFTREEADQEALEAKPALGPNRPAPSHNFLGAARGGQCWGGWEDNVVMNMAFLAAFDSQRTSFP